LWVKIFEPIAVFAVNEFLFDRRLAQRDSDEGL